MDCREAGKWGKALRRRGKIIVMSAAIIFLFGSLFSGCGNGGAGAGDSGKFNGDSSQDTANNADCADGPLAEPIAGCTPAPVPDSGGFKADCVARINQFRWDCQCLPPLDRWAEGETCADVQAEYDAVNGAHAGFRNGICAPRGRAQNECPGWGSETSVVADCLQLMWDEGPGDDFNAHGHYINMSSPNYTKVACGVYTTGSGDVWSVQNFE